MINREQFINEIAEVVNRNSMEKAFNDTPDYILARIAVEAMEMFTRASAHRDDFHEFRTADYEKKRNNILSRQKQEPAASCKGCPFTEICPDVKMKRQPEPGTQNGVQETGGARRTKGSASNGGFLC